MADDIPELTVGLLTFRAEGNEGGRYHSRVFHAPTESSGLTIGRGYDMKMRSKSEIRDDFLEAGQDTTVATLISQAAGMTGTHAEDFIAENHLENFVLSGEVQVALFDLEYARQAADTERLATKADVTEAYGETNWDALDGTIKEVLVDLRYRGDYTPTSRRFLQVHVAGNDLAAFSGEIADQDNWPNGPERRFQLRVDCCQAAV